MKSGFVSTFIDEKGFVRAAAVGGVSPQNFRNCHVTFENGVRGVFVCEKNDSKMQDCYIDIGASSFDEAVSKIDIGMTARFDADTFESDSVIVSKALDDRLGCYILMETLKKMPVTDNEVYFVFTSQEEVGLRGAKVSGFDINPDVAIAVDVTVAADTPGCDSYGCRLHGGAAIKIRDASAICSASVVEALESAAREHDIPFQRDVLTAGGHRYRRRADGRQGRACRRSQRCGAQCSYRLGNSLQERYPRGCRTALRIYRKRS